MFRVEWGTDENPLNFNFANFGSYKQAENFYNKKEDQLQKKYGDDAWVNILTNDAKEAANTDAEYVEEFQEPQNGYESYDLGDDDTDEQYVPFTIYLYTDKWDDELKKLEHHFEYIYEGSGSYCDVIVEDCTDEDDPCIRVTGQISGVESVTEFQRDLSRGVADYNIDDWDAKLSIPIKKKNATYMNDDQIRRDYENQNISYDKACEALIGLLEISNSDAQAIIDGWELTKLNKGITSADKLYKELKDYKWVGDTNDGPPGNICEWGADDDEVIDCVETFVSGYVNDKILDTQIDYTNDNTNIKATITFEDNSQAILNFFKTDDSWCFDTKDFGGTSYNKKNISKSCNFLKKVIGV